MGDKILTVLAIIAFILVLLFDLFFLWMCISLYNFKECKDSEFTKYSYCEKYRNF